MDEKYSDMFHDPMDLYNRAFSVNPGGALSGFGTWAGHVDRYLGMRKRLGDTVDAARLLNCPISQRALVRCS
jgi:hypothetical protein